jgi:Tfp pilus assembly protein FimT
MKKWESTLHDPGFGLAEFLVSSGILLVIAAAVFAMLAETQRTASYQSEIHAVLQNTRTAMSGLERYIRHAGNDPRNTAFLGVTIVSATEIRLRTDITGLTGPGNPDKGDPDGDTNDAEEDVTIRYNSTNQSIEITPHGGTAQAVANNISALLMTCYDAAGAVTTNGAEVRRIRVFLTGTSAVPNPQTGRSFSQQLSSDIQLSARN